MKHHSLNNVRMLFAVIAGALYMAINYYMEPTPVVGWMILIALFCSALIGAKLVTK